MLHGACRRQLEHNLQEWAVRVKTDYAWEDLVLPRQQKEELKQAANQIKYRRQVYEEWGFSGVLSYGTGLSVLLTGPPGTGKTMAAQVLAGAMGLELYKIQLPAVVSKYIGETEKNLRQIFREGKKSPAALFFDEADVLFGRRTEVKDSHDKYSNMEAAFLLQNMEEYAGVVILATNFPQNIDEAFRRRIKFTIEFSMPDRQHRRLLWEKSFPKQAPLGADVDLEYLAETFELSGSSIKNIAVNAAFLAAPGGEAVGMPHIIKALTGEYRKSGKYFSEEELL
ncbi:MAG: ATP-binding protein [Lachnospiraceae bacterium]|nr:ATP-binding protein [Lachnospiraceae bacterium]